MLVLGYVVALIATWFMAGSFNRNKVNFTLLGLFLTPVTSIAMLLILGKQRKDFIVDDNRDKAVHAVPVLGDIDDVLEEPKKVPQIEEVKTVATPVPPKQNTVKPKTKKGRYSKNKKSNKTKTTVRTSNVNNTQPDVVTPTVVASALYTNDDYSDYRTHTPVHTSRSSSSSYSCSSSYDSSSYDSGSSSSSCD